MEQTEVQYCFQSSNSSCPKEVRPTAVYVVMYISAAAVVMLTMCGNLMVIISISHFKQLHTPTNLLVLSLAVADFLIGVTVMPFCLIVLIETCWYFGETVCIIYNTLRFVLTSVSINHVACIAIDRYFAVCDPLLYSTKITVNITWLIIMLNWLISLLYNLALIYFNGNMNGVEEITICYGDCLFAISETWVIVDLLVVFILPCSVMIILYLKVFVVAKKHVKVISAIREHKSSNDENKSKKITIKSERKAVKTLGIVIAVFLLCLVPYYICTLVDTNVSLSSSSVVINFLFWLLYFNSAVNPIIYALFYPWFQKSVKLIVTLRIFKPASSLLNLFPQKL
ncbi:trace amine-associated receptor 13c-like [Amia ocellicauda]|uniref:trace amine-associated receptor 13c-like n=1 Tax=Amia ocellicauda TaxID=2972642 RepID=UPI00346402E8